MRVNSQRSLDSPIKATLDGNFYFIKRISFFSHPMVFANAKYFTMWSILLRKKTGLEMFEDN